MKDLELIYICAVRYGLGRRTYITGVISDYLLKQDLSAVFQKFLYSFQFIYIF